MLLEAVGVALFKASLKVMGQAGVGWKWGWFAVLYRRDALSQGPNVVVGESERSLDLG